MKYKWLNQKNNKKVIIFFNGWGMDESVVNHLGFEDYDVVMFYDYNTLNTEFEFSIFDSYDERYLIAWSMGVMTATLFDVKYNLKTAVNGTLKPIDNMYGIPVRIYDLTLKGFSPKGAEKFILNMGMEKVPVIKRDFENQKSELAALKTYSANPIFKYDRVFISRNDKIIPAKNQSAYWNIEPNLECGHCPFYIFKNWSDLL